MIQTNILADSVFVPLANGAQRALCERRLADNRR